MKYQLATFKELDFDTRCVILEMILPDDYYGRQEEIGFWIPPNFDWDSKADLPPTPPDIKAEEDKKFALLVDSISEKLFSIYSEIEIEDNDDVFTLSGERVFIGNLN